MNNSAINTIVGIILMIIGSALVIFQKKVYQKEVYEKALERVFLTLGIFLVIGGLFFLLIAFQRGMPDTIVISTLGIITGLIDIIFHKRFARRAATEYFLLPPFTQKGYPIILLLCGVSFIIVGLLLIFLVFLGE